MGSSTVFSTLLAGVLAWFFMPSQGGPNDPSLIQDPVCSGFTVQAKGDTTICTPGQVVRISSLVSSRYNTIRWKALDPAAVSIADTTAAATQVTVSASTRIVIRATQSAADIPNMVVNGDFSQGNTGFFTDYSFNNDPSGLGPLEVPGRYTLKRTAQEGHRHLVNCDERNTGNGLMLIANASGRPAEKVWCQKIAVTKGGEYALSAWAASVFDNNPGTIELRINNTRISSIALRNPIPIIGCNWRTGSGTWIADADTAEICIFNILAQHLGNDFAIDDIVFKPLCVATDTVDLVVANLDTDFTLVDTLCSTEASFAVSTLLDPLNAQNGTWTLDGRAVDTIRPAILPVGTHSLQYSVRAGSCLNQTTRTFHLKPIPKNGTPLPPLSVCFGQDTTIQLIQLLTNVDPGGSWKQVAGDSVSANGVLGVRSLGTGTYRFQYAHPVYGVCAPSPSIVEVIVRAQPRADAGSDLTWLCRDDLLSIGGTGSTAGPDITYTWIAQNGGKLSQSNLARTEAEAPGTYLLKVQDAGGCSATDTVVLADGRQTIALFSTPLPSSCGGTNQIRVDSALGGNPPYRYALNQQNWTTNTLFDKVPNGTHQLKAEDANGCTTTQSITVQGTNQLEGKMLLNGNDVESYEGVFGEEIRLELSSSIDPSQIKYVSWQPDGVACTDCRFILVTPDGPGYYYMELADLQGCNVRDTVFIRVPEGKKVFVPSAFNPQSTGVNKTLSFFASPDIVRIQNLLIADRWGNIVFKADAFDPHQNQVQWDGSWRGQLLTGGIYIYTLQAVTSKGEVLKRSGEVTVVE